MKRLSPLVLAAGLALATSASADVSGLYGNVIRGDFPNGQHVEVRLHKDGTFEETLPDGSKLTGTFVEDARGVCFTEPAPAPTSTPTECVTQLSGARLGDSWDLTQPHPYKLSIVADH